MTERSAASPAPARRRQASAVEANAAPERGARLAQRSDHGDSRRHLPSHGCVAAAERSAAAPRRREARGLRSGADESPIRGITRLSKKHSRARENMRAQARERTRAQAREQMRAQARVLDLILGNSPRAVCFPARDRRRAESPATAGLSLLHKMKIIRWKKIACKSKKNGV